MYSYKYILFALIGLWSSITFATDQNQFDFKKNEVSFGFYENHVLPKNAIHLPSPFFWHSRYKVDYGSTFKYERTIFHTQQYFSIVAGSNVSSWVLNRQVQLALSGFLEFRVWLFHTTSFNPYFVWSAAGPTVISRRFLGGSHLGGNLIFQDFLGIGAQVGKMRAVDVSLLAYHYSNGDLLQYNDGLDIPVVLSIGYSFN